jgi:DNA uptake protein ComE-like DNA-binding protein
MSHIRTLFATILVVGALYAPAATAQEEEGAATRLDPNTASVEEMAALEVVGPDLAAQIAAARPFAAITAFDAFLADKVEAGDRAELYTELFVPIELNTASREDIMLVPGMTSRMAHEFEEYRPYTDMEQFDREIGKYVDEAEVARLASYVTLEVAE